MINDSNNEIVLNPDYVFVNLGGLIMGTEVYNNGDSLKRRTEDVKAYCVLGDKLHSINLSERSKIGSLDYMLSEIFVEVKKEENLTTRKLFHLYSKDDSINEVTKFVKNNQVEVYSSSIVEGNLSKYL